MASLYIKDEAVTARVTRLARERGTTKTALVGQALDALENTTPAVIGPDDAPADPVEWLKWHRARHPLPPSTGRISDKAFFDQMWGEPD